MSAKQMCEGPLVVDLAEQNDAAVYSLDRCSNMTRHIRKVVSNPLQGDSQSAESNWQNHAGNLADNTWKSAMSPVSQNLPEHLNGNASQIALPSSNKNNARNLVDSSQPKLSLSTKRRDASCFVDPPLFTKQNNTEMKLCNGRHSAPSSTLHSGARSIVSSTQQSMPSCIQANSSCQSFVSNSSGSFPCEVSSRSPGINRKKVLQYLRFVKFQKRKLISQLKNGNLTNSQKWPIRLQLKEFYWRERVAKRHLKERQKSKTRSKKNSLHEKSAVPLGRVVLGKAAVMVTSGQAEVNSLPATSETANVKIPEPCLLSRTNSSADVEIIEVNMPKDSPDSPDEKLSNQQDNECGFRVANRSGASTPSLFTANADFVPNAMGRQAPSLCQTSSFDPRLAHEDRLRSLVVRSKIIYRKWRKSVKRLLKRNNKRAKCAKVMSAASWEGGTGTVTSGQATALPVDNGVQAHVQDWPTSIEPVEVVELSRPMSGMIREPQTKSKDWRSCKTNNRRKFLVDLPVDEGPTSISRFAENCEQNHIVPNADEKASGNTNNDVEVIQVIQNVQGIDGTCNDGLMQDLQKTRTSDGNSDVVLMQRMQNIQPSNDAQIVQKARIKDKEVVQGFEKSVGSNINSDFESEGANGNTDNSLAHVSLAGTSSARARTSAFQETQLTFSSPKPFSKALTGQKRPKLGKIGNVSAISNPAPSAPGTSRFQVRGNLLFIQPQSSECHENTAHKSYITAPSGNERLRDQNQTAGQQKTNLPKKKEFTSMEPEVVSCREESTAIIPASSAYKAYKLSDDLACVCVSCPTQEIALKGKVSVRVILGKVTVLGYILQPRKAYFDVYSPETTSLLSFKCERGTKAPVFAKTVLQAVMKEKNVPKMLADTILARTHKNAVVFLLRKLNDVPCQYISKFREYRFLFDCGTLRGGLRNVNASIDFLGCHFADPQQVRTVCITPSGREAGEKVKQAVVNATDRPQVVVVCGGKNVGKSTFCRFLINSLLSDHRVCKKVCYLECDVGQTEFTPSGCVSLHVVQRPLLGCKSPSDDPIRYVSCLKFVHRGYLKKYAQKNVPLIVNTMGWTRGMGLNFLVDTLALTRPTHVIQFQHPSKNKSLPRIDNNFLSRTSGMVFHLHSASHQLFCVATASHIYNKFRDYKAADHRNLCLMSYLGKSLTVNVDTRNLSLEALRPYTVPWHTVAIHISTASVPRHLVMLSLNASVVGLCGVPEDSMITVKDQSMPKFLRQTPICHCYGFGIVRSIDPVQKIFYIITPLSLNQLYNVNAFIKGVLEIPECVMVNQNCPGEIPYVQTTTAPTMVAGDRPVQRPRTVWARKRRRMQSADFSE